MDNPRLFLALLNGVLKKFFEKDNTITVELLKEKVFTDVNVSNEDIASTFNMCAQIMKKAVFENWEPSQIEAFLKTTSLSESQREVFVRFWQLQRNKLHDAICKDSTWNNSLQKFSWRIDVKTKSKDIAEMNEPVAIVELTIGDHGKENVIASNRANEIVRFEINREQLSDVLVQITKIQQQIGRT